MRFITIFRHDPNSTAPPPSAEEMGRHREEMGRQVGEAVTAGTMVTTGGIGYRETTGGRIINKGGKATVEAPPKGDGGWMAAGGFGIVDAASRDELIESLKKQILSMGEGSVEFVHYNQFYPAPEQKLSGETAPPRSLTAGVVPYLNIDGASEASAFYQKAFGAKEIARMPGEDGKRLMHCHLEINGGSLMIADNFPEMGFPAVQRTMSDVMHLIVDDGDAWWSRAINAGCKQDMPFERAFWGDRYGVMTDPFGVRWALVEPAKK
jgi:PhnB protein